MTVGCNFNSSFGDTLSLVMLFLSAPVWDTRTPLELRRFSRLVAPVNY
jgi:hypothetical protein